jgi:hypothetical protein
MRSFVRISTLGCALALIALTTLALGGTAEAGPPVNWSAMPNTYASSYTAGDASVSCVKSDFCMAVGSGAGAATAELWNGASWSALTMPTVANSTDSSLASVSCVNTNFCVAVGLSIVSGDTELIEQWGGSGWSVVQGTTTSSTPMFLNGVSCTSDTFCMAGGYDNLKQGPSPYVEELDGSTWSGAPLPVASGYSYAAVRSASCTSRSFCMMGGNELPSSATSSSPAAWSWNGSSWTATTTPSSTQTTALYGLSCTKRSFCVGVGSTSPPTISYSNVVLSWNGSSWTTATGVPTPTGGGQLQSVSCVSARSCTAVGTVGTFNSGDQVLYLHRGAWTQATAPAGPAGSTTTLAGVDCVRHWACVAAGTSSVSSGSGTTSVPFEASASIVG